MTQIDQQREMMLRNGQIQKLRTELRVTKLEIQRARSSLELAMSEIHEYKDLHLYLDAAEAAFAAYKTNVTRLDDIVDRLHELEG